MPAGAASPLLFTSLRAHPGAQTPGTAPCTQWSAQTSDPPCPRVWYCCYLKRLTSPSDWHQCPEGTPPWLSPLHNCNHVLGGEGQTSAGRAHP